MTTFAWGDSHSADRVMAHIAGLLPSLWGKRRFMVMQLYFDESGDEDFFVIAGYIATPEAWAELSKEWERLLPLVSLPDADGLREFKMNEIIQSEERMAHVPAFYRLIEQYVDHCVSIAFRPSELESAIKRIKVTNYRVTIKDYDKPYLFAFRLLTDLLNRRREDMKFFDQDAFVDLFADENSLKGTVQRSWFKVISQLPEHEAKRFGDTPRFEDSRLFPPLQAADFWAWWVRRWSAEHGPLGMESAAFPWKHNLRVPPKTIVWAPEQWIAEWFYDAIKPNIPPTASIELLPSAAE